MGGFALTLPYYLQELQDQARLGSGTPEFTDFAHGTVGPGGFWQGGGVLAPNGKLYIIAQDDFSVIAMDPTANGKFCDAILLSGYMNKF